MRSPPASSATGADPGGPTADDGEERSPIEVVLRNQVLAQHALTRCGDYFEILGIRPDAHRDEIVQAHAALASVFAAGSLPAALARECAAELDDIRRVLDESVRLMTDDALRERYRRHRARPRSAAPRAS